MRKHKGSRGAISVFLSLILVPCIVSSCLFVDLGRVHLSKAAAESSADLALNTLLTNYDGDLKEWYGMVASCQNIDEFYDISAKYFLRALSSQGLSDDEIVLLSDFYAKTTNDDTIYDLLKVQPTTGVKVNAVPNSDLSNPALIKDQIVDFMKYRAPIEITGTIIDHIKRDSSAKGTIEADVNKPLVDDKQEFYEADGELTAKAYYTYLAIHDYFNYSIENNITNDYLSQDYTKFGTYPDIYRQIMHWVVKNLSNTAGLQPYHRFVMNLDTYLDFYSNPSKSFSAVYTDKQPKKNPEKYIIDISKIQTLVTDLKTSVSDFNTAKSGYANAASPLVQKLPFGDEPAEVNGVQWWVQMNKAVNSDRSVSIPNPDNPKQTLTYTHHEYVAKTGEEMLRNYAKVLAINSCNEISGSTPEGWSSVDEWYEKLEVETVLSEVETLQQNYLTNPVPEGLQSDSYLKAATALQSASDANKNQIKSSALTVKISEDQYQNIDEAITYVHDAMVKERDIMSDCIDKLNLAIDGDQDKDPKGNTLAMDDLVGLADTYDKALDKWKGSADGSTTDMGQEDREEIYGKDGDPNKKGLEEALNIDKKSVEVLKTRLVNIRSQFQAMVDAINSYKIGEVRFVDIQNITDFKNAAAVDPSQIKLTNQELDNYAEQLWNVRFAPKTVPMLEHGEDDDYNLKINPQTGEVKTPELYIALHKKYYGVPKDTMDEFSEEKDQANQAKDDKEKDAKNKSRYHGGGKDIPRKFIDQLVPSKSDNLMLNLVGFVKNVIEGDFTGMRDDLYATTYIMKMFSHATYEREGLYHLLDEDTQKTLTLDNFDDADHYQSVMGTDPQADERTWVAERSKYSYNKSLTNKMINLTHNPAYCAEIEYILHGNVASGDESGNVQNVKKVYSDLYVLRYALNLVSGFDHFWATTLPVANLKGTTAIVLHSAASAIWGATAGVIPIPVTEAVLIPLLTVFETCSDMDRLERGFPVELYKLDKKNWWFSFESQSDFKPKKISQVISAIQNLDQTMARSNTGNGLYYSDYLTVLVYLGLTGPAQDQMYQRVAEVIQFNLKTMMGEGSTYSLKNSKMYFQMESDLRVKPLMIALPVFRLEEFENELDTKTDWCTYHIKTVRGYP